MGEATRRAEPEFQLNEFFETLLRVRDSQPRRYAREVSPGTRARVELYEEQKLLAAERAAMLEEAACA
ncbi:MAG: hypothetical protein H7Z38_21555 [Rubrivivax sp.]|nr:hypothetical protein [Pyrinomonadaceae bacterium]